MPPVEVPEGESGQPAIQLRAAADRRVPRCHSRDKSADGKARGPGPVAGRREGRILDSVARKTRECTRPQNRLVAINLAITNADIWVRLRL
jgi:hypothetical protein